MMAVMPVRFLAVYPQGYSLCDCERLYYALSDLDGQVGSPRRKRPR